jgi:hypothetical protein|tara:strand:- start:611 stop:859 length:249 start_codon:yes stop_codon:yes gene_type:complete
MNAVINNELLKMNLTQLNQMVSIINDIKVMKSKSSLSVGANVFVVQKTKKTPAVINKINQTRAVVTMKGKQYNVPFSMLEAA